MLFEAVRSDARRLFLSFCVFVSYLDRKILQNCKISDFVSRDLDFDFRWPAAMPATFLFAQKIHATCNTQKTNHILFAGNLHAVE